MKTFFLLAGIALAAYAAPITSGTIHFALGEPEMTFDMRIDGTRVTGTSAGLFNDAVMACRYGCFLGQQVGPGFVVLGSSFGGWWGRSGSSLLEATGPAMTLQGEGVMTSTFSLTGKLCGDAGPGGPIYGQCWVWYPDITGSGTVSVVVELLPNNGMYPQDLYRTTSATFTFTEMPEPATVIVTGSGLAAIALQRFRKTRIGPVVLSWT